MQYSPKNAIPYVSMVDGGTIEMVRAAGVKIVTSADLVQKYEACWSKEQLNSHLSEGIAIDRIVREAFLHAAQSVREKSSSPELDLKEWISGNSQRQASLLMKVRMWRWMPTPAIPTTRRRKRKPHPYAKAICCCSTCGANKTRRKASTMTLPGWAISTKGSCKVCEDFRRWFAKPVIAAVELILSA